MMSGDEQHDLMITHWKWVTTRLISDLDALWKWTRGMLCLHYPLILHLMRRNRVGSNECPGHGGCLMLSWQNTNEMENCCFVTMDWRIVGNSPLGWQKRCKGRKGHPKVAGAHLAYRLFILYPLDIWYSASGDEHRWTGTALRLAQRHGKSIRNWQRYRIRSVWNL